MQRHLFSPVEKAAITTGPKVLTLVCTINIPRFMTDCCRQVRNEKFVTSPIVFLSTCFGENRDSLERSRVYMATPNPEIYWDITVASAAPFTPLFNTNTKKRSKAILIIVETPRKAKGTVEFPKALRNEENQL